MSFSFTATESRTFTLTHARHLAAKVAADLKRVQRLYGYPSDQRIDEYEAEVTELLKQGYLEAVIYGFKRDGKWIEPTLRYTAMDFADRNTDDDPGRILPGKDVSGATFGSFLTHNNSWLALTSEERASVEQLIPLKRGSGTEPQVDGYFVDDRTYASGGRSLGRASVRSF